MNVLLFSNGKANPDQALLEYGSDWIAPAIKKTDAKRLLFIPYAMLRGEYDDRLKLLQKEFDRYGVSISGIHQHDDPVIAIEEADGYIVSGGNTWVLNKQLHDLGLVRPLRKAILSEDKLYIGWSAGTNIACPTIRTTNDMPIVSASILTALNLVPFQINPHYVDATISGHMGESRDERIEEFLIQNPYELVVGICEGTMLQVSGDTLTYHSSNGSPMKLFQSDKTPSLFNTEDDINHLMSVGC
ncbi:dipeptidase PepE [Vibrio hannami]|uniref:dipeptidase PepE n=1 Tax=Vibrio hannami TaxID=2717094 RepID=UPI0024105382|nr:dipeptidase PepE [Vibrio hannami]MDG3086098.1 dipeptidase PepE [Vibrio hannami]